MMREVTQKKADRKFLIYLLILIVFGLVALISASGPAGYEKFHDVYHFFKRQMLYGILPGVIVFLILAKIDYRLWNKLSWLFYCFSLALLVLVFIPGIGVMINGSKCWISLGSSTFQPSELAKLAIIIIMANLLCDPERDLNDWKKGLLPVLGIIAPAVLLIAAQPDVGTLSILVVIIFAMLFLSHTPKRYLAILGLLCIIVFVGLVWVAPYRVQRITTFLHPELDPKGVGYHINQAFLAVGSGGFWGFGFGNSRQKYQYLPETSADSIYAIIAEETGFIVSAGLIILILLIGWRGMEIAKGAPDEFGRLIAGGIVVWFMWQSFLNIGAMVGALPLTGVPLPFVSYGGSAMLVALAGAGMVANVSKAD